jgi:methyl-accepting chemotaxis protein
VVAGEVRKLAAEARTSAESVAAITRTVTQRVDSAARTMTAGAAHVGEIEEVAQQVEAALATILDAAERTRAAAESVTAAAEGNAAAAVEAAGGIAQVAETAVVHAEAAEGVRAATTQQESACAMVSEATQRLIGNAAELRGLVGNLRIGEFTAEEGDDGAPPAEEPALAAVAQQRPFIDLTAVDPNVLVHAEGLAGASERLRRRRLMAQA